MSSCPPGRLAWNWIKRCSVVKIERDFRCNKNLAIPANSASHKRFAVFRNPVVSYKELGSSELSASVFVSLRNWTEKTRFSLKFWCPKKLRDRVSTFFLARNVFAVVQHERADVAPSSPSSPPRPRDGGGPRRHHRGPPVPPLAEQNARRFESRLWNNFSYLAVDFRWNIQETMTVIPLSLTERMN